jgi:ABC-2 type transport system permease protein
VRAVLEELAVYRRMVSAAVRSQMQYRTSFFVGSATDFLAVFSDFLPIYFLMLKFGHLQGWTMLELCLLYGMVETSWSLVEISFKGFEDFGSYLIRGEVDRWLLRPRSVVVQVAAHQFELRRLGRVAQGLAVLAIGVVGLGLGPPAWVWIVTGIAGGVLFFVGIVMLSAASMFWTLGATSELQNMLTYGGSTALTFPISIYTRWFRRAITFGVPLAFVNYFPALAALGRVESDGWPAWLPWLSPGVCLLVLLASRGCFEAGLRRYESTGS